MKTFAAILLCCAMPTAAIAQTTSAPNGGALGGLGNLLGGGGLPGIASIGAGNAAGLLGYCLKNNLLGAANRVAGGIVPAPAATATPAATGAQGVLQRLMGQQNVQTSPGFAAGQAGKVQTGAGQGLSLASLRGQVKTQACNLVLNRAKSFL